MSELKTTLQIGVDGSQATAGITGVKKAAQDMQQTIVKGASDAAKAVDGLSASAGRAGDGFAGQAKRFLNSLQQTTIATTEGKAAAAAFKAEQLGVADAAAPFIAKLKAATDSTHEFSLNSSAARQELGRLASDIANGNWGRFDQTASTLANATGLMSLAFSGVGAAVLGAIAVLGTFGVALVKGAEEANAFNKALTLTGGYAGETAGQLSDMATAIGQATGSRSGAVAALTALANGGRVAGAQFDAVATAAVNMSQVSGQSIDEVVKQFESLAAKPTETISALNDQYHFLTAAQYEEIASLEREGQTQSAATLATNLYAQAIDTRTAEIKSNLGTLQKAWDSIKDHASAAWAAMLSIGAPDTLDSVNAKISQIQEKLSKLPAAQGFSTFGQGAAYGKANPAAQLQAQLQQLQEVRQTLLDQQTAADKKAKDQQTQNAATAAQKQIDILAEQLANNQQKREQAVAKIKTLYADLAKSNPGGQLTDKQAAQEQALIANAEKQYKDPTVTDNAATKMLETLRQQQAALEGQLSSSDKLQDAQQQLLKFDQQIADLKGKSILTADQKSLLAAQDQIRAQLQTNAALEQQIKLKQDNQKLDALQNTLDSTLDNDKQQYSDQLESYGLGTKSQQQLREQQRIYDQYAKQYLSLTNQNAAHPDDEYYDQATAKLNANLSQRLALLQGFYDKQSDMEGDWELGYKHALADYVDQSQNSYAQAGEAFQSVTGVMGEALDDFVTTGKFNFASFTASILADLAKIEARQALGGILGGVLSLLTPTITAAPGASVGGAALGSTSGLSGSWGAISGARASGGPTDPDSLYRVNENGPELYSVGGKTYLMSGADGGYVTPLRNSASAGAGGDINVSTNVVVQGGGSTVDSSAANSAASQLQDSISAAVKDRIAREVRPGGIIYNMKAGR